MGMNTIVCLLGSIRNIVGGLGMPWISPNLQARKWEGNNQVPLCGWCSVNPCPLLKPHNSAPLPSSLILFFMGQGERGSLMILRVAVTALLQSQTSTCRQTASQQKSQLQENYSVQGEDRTWHVLLPNKTHGTICLGCWTHKSNSLKTHGTRRIPHLWHIISYLISYHDHNAAEISICRLKPKRSQLFKNI